MAIPSESEPVTQEVHTPTLHRTIPDVRMEIYCHCDGRMRMISHQEYEDRVEQRFECTECDEAVTIVKDRKWEETLPGD